MSFLPNPLRYLHTPRTLKVLLVLVLLVPLFAPVNFIIIQPGEGTPLFPKVLKIADKSLTVYPSTGQMYLLSIWVSNPESKILGAEVLKCWAQSDCVVFPRSALYDKETDDKKEFKASRHEMKVSQSSAVLAARRYLSQNYSGAQYKSLQDSSVKVDLKDTGGPSGGLIFSMALVDLLTSTDFAQKRKIAASGTISASGHVGAIGGISEKIIAAKKVGATILIASRENCDEIPAHVSGLGVYAVDNLAEALSFLKSPESLDFRGVRGCINLGA